MNKNEDTPMNKFDSEKTALQKIKKNKCNVAVLVYAPWCGHCHAFAPTWYDEKQKNKNVSFDTTEVNADRLDMFPEFIRKRITGFPTVLIIKDGDVNSDYAGNRSSESLQQILASSFSSSSPTPRKRSPSPTPRKRSPSPSPRKRSPSPTPRKRSPSPSPKKKTQKKSKKNGGTPMNREDLQNHLSMLVQKYFG